MACETLSTTFVDLGLRDPAMDRLLPMMNPLLPKDEVSTKTGQLHAPVVAENDPVARGVFDRWKVRTGRVESPTVALSQERAA